MFDCELERSPKRVRSSYTLWQGPGVVRFFERKCLKSEGASIEEIHANKESGSVTSKFRSLQVECPIVYLIHENRVA